MYKWEQKQSHYSGKKHDHPCMGVELIENEDMVEISAVGLHGCATTIYIGVPVSELENLGEVLVDFSLDLENAK